jgi:hypothetical protein
MTLKRPIKGAVKVTDKSESKKPANKGTGGYSIAISGKDTGYGRSKAYITPPTTMVRVYPDNNENELWFNYEERPIYYPLCIMKDGRKVDHLSNVYMTMVVNENVRGSAAPTASTRANAQKGTFWFKAIKPYVFGEIEIRFELTDERQYVDPERRITTSPLTFTITVDVDEFGHAKPVQPDGAPKNTVVDYVYDIDPRMRRPHQQPTKQQSTGMYVARPRDRGASSSRGREHGAASAMMGMGVGGLSEYEKKTLYSEGDLGPVRRSYKDGGGSSSGSYNNNNKMKAERGGEDSNQRKRSRAGYNGTERSPGSVVMSLDNGLTGNVHSVESGTDLASVESAESDSEAYVVPQHGIWSSGGGGMDGRSTTGHKAVGLDHALFDMTGGNGGGSSYWDASSSGGGVEISGFGIGGSGYYSNTTAEASFGSVVATNHHSNNNPGGEAAVQCDRLLAILSNLLAVDKSIRGTEMAEEILEQLDLVQKQLPPATSSNSSQYQRGASSSNNINIGQLRELLTARKSLDDAIKVVLSSHVIVA